MKKETYQNKLAELLGLKEFIKDPKTGKSEKESRNLNRDVAIPEEEIQEFRAIQGVIYFLQAPELFHPKICPHCKEQFLVSRKQVAFCSYTCIRKDLEEKGLKWEKGKDIELLVKDVYDGNEPIWIKNLDRIRAVLDESSFKPSLLAVN